MNEPHHPGGGDTPAAAAPVAVYELSGWWRRVGATMLDGLIVAVAAVPLELAVDLGLGGHFLIGESSPSVKSTLGWMAAGSLVDVVFFIPLVVIVMGLKNGQSFGKMAVKIRVIREDGQPVNIGFAFKRELLVKTMLFEWAALLTLGIASLLDGLWPLWDDENRALHDRIVRTRVVRTDIAPTIQYGQPATPGVMPPPPFGYPPPPQPYQVPPYPAPPFPVAPPRQPENPLPPGES